ncbi:unnamed protein product [Gadus morhua 'NCC']
MDQRQSVLLFENTSDGCWRARGPGERSCPRVAALAGDSPTQGRVSGTSVCELCIERRVLRREEMIG